MIRDDWSSGARPEARRHHPPRQAGHRTGGRNTRSGVPSLTCRTANRLWSTPVRFDGLHAGRSEPWRLDARFAGPALATHSELYQALYSPIGMAAGFAENLSKHPLEMAFIRPHRWGRKPGRCSTQLSNLL